AFPADTMARADGAVRAKHTNTSRPLHANRPSKLQLTFSLYSVRITHFFQLYATKNQKLLTDMFTLPNVPPEPSMTMKKVFTPSVVNINCSPPGPTTLSAH